MKTLFLIISSLLILSVAAFGENNERLRFPVQKNGKSGYINLNGSLVIPPKFYIAGEFTDGIAIVMPTENSGETIDADGNTVGKLPLYKSIEPFSEGLAVVFQDETHWGFVDSKGKLVIPLKFSGATSFSEGLAAVGDRSGKWGWIDKTGQYVIQPQFDTGDIFKEGMARIGRGPNGGKKGFIGKSGKVVVDPVYIYAEDFSEGLSVAFDGKRKRYLDKSGKSIIQVPENGGGNSFREGFAAVKFGSDAGFIDKTGKMVLKVPFDVVSSFSEGLAPVRSGDSKTGKWGCVDKTGKVIISPQFPEKPVFKNGLAKIRTPEGVGYINHAGTWVWKPSK